MPAWVYIALVVIGLLASFEVLSAPVELLWPRSLGGNTLWRGSRRRRAVSLTFDDGPSPYTDAILDILHAHKMPATFFVRGCQAERFPGIIKRMAAEGHTIGNHLFKFEALRGLRKVYHRFEEDEVACTQAVILRLAGTAPRYFRSPGSQLGRNLWMMVRRQKLLAVNGAIPFPNPEREAAEQMTTIRSIVKPGAIIILHDGDDHHPNSDRPRATRDLLPELVAFLQREGYAVVSLDELQGSAVVG